MKKFLIVLLLLIFPAVTFAANPVKVPDEIFKWVQSTPRGNYYFNYQVCGYHVKLDGTLDLNQLIVPTICTYDDVQIQDVIQKRRWNNKSTKGYNILAGRADYLKFDLKNNTVQVTRRADIDKTFTELDSDTSGKPVKLSDFTGTEVACKFYREILIWAKQNNDWMIRRSRGKLSAKDSKLKPEDFPIYKIPLPGEEEDSADDKD
ncbi:MAG: hypothetical protein J5809_05115 [Selenomonadaceae bacterium]|nr:hypothetical protein [Selenomonadaceae bacterium]